MNLLSGHDSRRILYPQLKDHIYLDHSGSTLHSAPIIDEYAEYLKKNLTGNTHSASNTAKAASDSVEAVRSHALDFFNADPSEWDLIFVANTTAAIKLVGESLRDYTHSKGMMLSYGYHVDSHTSLVGVGSFAHHEQLFTNDHALDDWIEKLDGSTPSLNLVAYPGQSNMTGRRLPRHWPASIRKKCPDDGTITLMDAAALLTTAPLDLHDTLIAPDLVTLSFTKIFGFPELGALLVQKRLSYLFATKKYFGGGTVDMIIPGKQGFHVKRESLHDALEEGTKPVKAITALGIAFSWHESVLGPKFMESISKHTSSLTAKMFNGLCALRHRNNKYAVEIYNQSDTVYGDSSVQGPVVAFNMINADGSYVAYDVIETLASKMHISLRTGSLCNPGGMQKYLQWTNGEMLWLHQNGHRCSKPSSLVHGKPTGMVRVSLGAMSNGKDVDRFLHFLYQSFVLHTEASEHLDSDTSVPAHVAANL